MQLVVKYRVGGLVHVASSMSALGFVPLCTPSLLYYSSAPLAQTNDMVTCLGCIAYINKQIL